MEYYIHNGELYHHGIKGMKWGIRRFQNKDGSMTNAGKKRLTRKQKKNLKKAREARAERQKLLKSGKLPASKMTDAELNAKIRRLQMEKQYKDLVRDTKQVDKGKEFAKKYLGEAANKILWDNAVDIGKQVAKHYGVEFANQKIGDTVIFTNNKKKS